MIAKSVIKMWEQWRRSRPAVKTFVLRREGEDTLPGSENKMSNDEEVYTDGQQLHQERLADENDINAQLQRVRVAGEGEDILGLSQEKILQAFDPEGTLTQQQLNDKMAYYIQQHSKQDFAGQQTAPVKYQFGVDRSTGQQRQAGPGETVDQLGQLQMVDPRYADQMAERMRNISEPDARQSMRRQAHFKTLAQVVLNPVQDPSGPSVMWVDDEQFRNLKSEYIEAKDQGYPDSRMDFLPTFAYAWKLWPEGQQPLRPRLSNECGFMQMASNTSSRLTGKIVCLKSDHFGTKHSLQIQVPLDTNQQPEVTPQVIGPTGHPYPQQTQAVEIPSPPYVAAPQPKKLQARQEIAEGVERLPSGSTLVRNPNSPLPQPFPLSQYSNQTGHTAPQQQVISPSSHQLPPRQVEVHQPQQTLPPPPGPLLPRR